MSRSPLYILRGTLLLGLILGGCSSGSRPGTSEEVVAENAAWTWFTDECALVADSALYVGHVDTAGAVGVTTVGLGRGPDTTVRLSKFREVDDHDNPALLQLDEGRILATYAQHQEEPFWYWRGERAEARPVDWSGQQRTDPEGAKVTYSNLFQLSGEGGRVYNLFRALHPRRKLAIRSTFRLHSAFRITYTASFGSPPTSH